MLEELRIVSLGVIDDAVLEFGPGLNVVTGETGAGKTMVVSALQLLLGERADSGAVRRGADRARVEGRVLLRDDAETAGRVDELGGELDGDVLILARSIGAEGRSRASVGGAAVPAGTLASVSDGLVVVHGQSDQQRLLRADRQRGLLDAFGADDVAQASRRYQEAFDALSRVNREIADVTDNRRARAQEADLLRFGVAEVESVDPQPGEDTALRDEESRLAHVDGLRRAADEARLALSGDETAPEGADALALVAAARKAVDTESVHDPGLAELADRLASASYVLADVAADLSSYAASLDVDPARLAWVQERRAAFSGLTRKYGETVDEVLDWAVRSTARLTELGDDDQRLAELGTEHRRLMTELDAAGRRLHDARRRAGDELGTRVTAELAALAMPNARFSVALEPLPEPRRDGPDDVAFLLSAHEGADPRPLQRGASGGELSRVMLALEVCLAGSNPAATMVFDEVDAGVGGKAAVEVGRRLSRLARSVQVIVVTHLPQVAAFADRHHRVVKDDAGAVAATGVTALDEAGRRTELSRMLAGLEDSETALAHAEELVALASAERES
jgi:DNA repair protein RecN (Recombination protein N)